MSGDLAEAAPDVEGRADLASGLVAQGGTGQRLVAGAFGHQVDRAADAAEVAEEQGVVDVPLSITYTHSVAVANAVAITKASQAEREKRRDVKAELAQQFKEMRGMLDDLGEQTAMSAEAKGAGEPVSE